MLQLVKRLCEAIGSHLSGRDVLQVDFAVLDLVLDVVVVDIDVLRTLMMTFRGDELYRRLIVAKELQRGNVRA
jgi:hypothetical protein